MEGIRSAGSLNAMPTSVVGWDTFTPPRAVSCGVFGTFRKLKTELPPKACAFAKMEMERANMSDGIRKPYENTFYTAVRERGRVQVPGSYSSHNEN